jgi:hypothetical protein
VNQKKVLNNMYLTVKEMAKAGFYDYEIINIGEPKKIQKESQWNERVGRAWNNKYYVPFQIKISKNKNFENAMLYMAETLISISLSGQEKTKHLDVDKYVYDLNMVLANQPGKTYTYGNTRKNRKQGLVGKTYTSSPYTRTKSITLIGKDPTDEIWRTLKIFDEELYKFKISNGASKDYYNLYPHSEVVTIRNFTTAWYFEKNYSWIARNYGYNNTYFSYTDEWGNERNGLTDIKNTSKRDWDPITPAQRIENHPFMFSLNDKYGYIDVDNITNWMTWNVNDRYAKYWIWGTNYRTDWILINPKFSMTINFLNFLTLDELSNIKSYKIEPTRKFVGLSGRVVYSNAIN